MWPRNSRSRSSISFSSSVSGNGQVCGGTIVSLGPIILCGRTNLTKISETGSHGPRKYDVAMKAPIRVREMLRICQKLR